MQNYNDVFQLQLNNNFPHFHHNQLRYFLLYFQTSIYNTGTLQKFVLSNGVKMTPGL
jgi:hypothetical protein